MLKKFKAIADEKFRCRIFAWLCRCHLPLFDGVAKTCQLLRCCDCLAASTYLSTPHGSTIARLAFGAFCLAIPFDAFCESIFFAFPHPPAMTATSSRSESLARAFACLISERLFSGWTGRISVPFSSFYGGTSL
jgi:hypothetical protein